MLEVQPEGSSRQQSSKPFSKQTIRTSAHEFNPENWASIYAADKQFTSIADMIKIYAPYWRDFAKQIPNHGNILDIGTLHFEIDTILSSMPPSQIGVHSYRYFAIDPASPKVVPATVNFQSMKAGELGIKRPVEWPSQFDVVVSQFGSDYMADKEWAELVKAVKSGGTIGLVRHHKQSFDMQTWQRAILEMKSADKHQVFGAIEAWLNIPNVANWKNFEVKIDSAIKDYMQQILPGWISFEESRKRATVQEVAPRLICLFNLLTSGIRAGDRRAIYEEGWKPHKTYMDIVKHWYPRVARFGNGEDKLMMRFFRGFGLTTMRGAVIRDANKEILAWWLELKKV